MLADKIGRSAAELVEGIVASEDSHGMDAAVAGGFNIVFHVADEDGFIGDELVLFEDIVDELALIPDAGVGVA